MSPILCLENVSRSFGVRSVLRKVNLQVMESESLAILGPNGSGKTTLLKIMSTLLRPSSGKLLFFNQDFYGQWHLLRRRLGVLLVQGYLYNDFSVRENLRFYARMYGLSCIESLISEWLEKAHLVFLENEPLRHLSRGERQKVAIIRSLLHSPEIILWDEPLTGLDTPSKNWVKDLVQEKKKDATLICTAHDSSGVKDWTDRQVELQKGLLC